MKTSGIFVGALALAMVAATIFACSKKKTAQHETFCGLYYPQRLKYLSAFYSFIRKTIAIVGCVSFLAVTTSSCKALGYKLIGVKHLNGFDKKAYDGFLQKLPDVDYVDIVGDAEQFQSVMKISSDSTMRHSLYQPIQILYFHKNDLVSYHINCTAPSKGLDLDWNYQGRFESFPPVSPIEVKDYSLSLADYRNIYTEIAENDGYCVVVFWTNMLYKFSRSAIMTVLENIECCASNLDVKLYFVNNDIFFF